MAISPNINSILRAGIENLTMEVERNWTKPYVEWEPHLQHEFVKWFADTYGETSIHEHLNEFRAVKDVMASVEEPAGIFNFGWTDPRTVYTPILNGALRKLVDEAPVSNKQKKKWWKL